MEKTLIYMEADVLWGTIDKITRKAVKEQLATERERESPALTIFAVAKKLRRAHITVKKMVQAGVFHLTPDGKILASEVNQYLGINQ